jgi:hypothetical protein
MRRETIRQIEAQKEAAKSKEAHNHMSGETNGKPTLAKDNDVRSMKAPAENQTAAIAAEAEKRLSGMNEQEGRTKGTKRHEEQILTKLKNLRKKELD